MSAVASPSPTAVPSRVRFDSRMSAQSSMVSARWSGESAFAGQRHRLRTESGFDMLASPYVQDQFLRVRDMNPGFGAGAQYSAAQWPQACPVGPPMQTGPMGQQMVMQTGLQQGMQAGVLGTNGQMPMQMMSPVPLGSQGTAPVGSMMVPVGMYHPAMMQANVPQQMHQQPPRVQLEPAQMSGGAHAGSYMQWPQQQQQQQQQQVHSQRPHLAQQQQQQQQPQQNQQQILTLGSAQVGANRSAASAGKPAVPALPDGKRTTVMLRNLPDGFTRDALLEFLDSQGFSGKYDFAYLPVDFDTLQGLQHAFVNLVSPEDAAFLRTKLEGFCAWAWPSDHVCKVAWNDKQQGLHALVERYRNSPVMHESVPDVCKPVIFTGGRPAPFPPPTQKVKAPKILKGKGK